MAVKKIEIETPDGKKKSITLSFDKDPSESELNAAVEHYMSTLGQKELKKPELYRGQNNLEEYFKNLENQPPMTVPQKIGAGLKELGKTLISPITGIPNIPGAIMDFYSQNVPTGPGADNPHLPGEYGADPRESIALLSGALMGDAAGQIPARVGVGAARAAKGAAKTAINPKTWIPAGAGSWIGGHIGQAFGLPFREGASPGAAIGAMSAIPEIYRAGRAGYQSAANIPGNLLDYFSGYPDAFDFGPKQIPASSPEPIRTSGAIPMPPATSAPAPLPHPVQATETAPPMLWGPSAALNASTEGAFTFPQRQIAAPGATPPSTPIQMPGKVSYSPRSSVGPVQGQVPLPFNLLDKLREVRSLAEIAYPEAAGPERPIESLKPVKAPAKGKASTSQPQSPPTKTTTDSESADVTPKEKTSETVPESKTTETTSQGAEGSYTQDPPSKENKVLTMSFVSDQAKQVGRPYLEVEKFLREQGYLISSDFDTEKFQRRGYGIGP